MLAGTPGGLAPGTRSQIGYNVILILSDAVFVDHGIKR